MTTPTRTRKGTIDSVCAEAVELARDAAEEGSPGDIGEHLGVVAEDERVVTHRFATANPAYRGWHWAVTLVRASRSKDPTVAEIVLLPGEDAVLAPAWVPWVERFQPGDLAPGDILPPPENDDRLVPGYTGEADAPYDPADPRFFDETANLIADELGLSRPRVLSPVGRADAVDRWYSGDRGPEAAMAAAAPAHCASCGFQVPVAGSVGRVFGICANEYSPDDGKVVSFDHGCGAHSEVAATASTLAERPPLVVDHLDFDLVELDAEAEAAPAPEQVDEVAVDLEGLEAEAAEIDAEGEADLAADALVEAVEPVPVVEAGENDEAGEHDGAGDEAVELS